MAKARMETRIDEMSRQIAGLITDRAAMQERVTSLEERLVALETDQGDAWGPGDDDDEQTIREMEDAGE